MNNNEPVSPEVLQLDLASELARLQQVLEKAEGKIMQLELALLQSRDFAMGAAAEANSEEKQSPIIRAMYIESQRQLGDANAHITSHLAHIARLEEVLIDLSKLHQVNKDLRSQIQQMNSSITWRIGKLIMTPIRVLKRIFK